MKTYIRWNSVMVLYKISLHIKAPIEVDLILWACLQPICKEFPYSFLHAQIHLFPIQIPCCEDAKYVAKRS